MKMSVMVMDDELLNWELALELRIFEVMLRLAEDPETLVVVRYTPGLP